MGPISKEATRENGFLLKVLLTATKVQVVVMSLLPGEEIGSEIHEGDQLLYAAKGQGVAVLNDSNENFANGTERLSEVPLHGVARHPGLGRSVLLWGRSKPDCETQQPLIEGMK